MKHSTFYITLLIITCWPYATYCFVVYNTPFAFERRYNANSFIFNCNQYYKKYSPAQDPIGADAIEKLEAKKNRPKKGRRWFIHYASE